MMEKLSTKSTVLSEAVHATRYEAVDQRSLRHERTEGFWGFAAKGTFKKKMFGQFERGREMEGEVVKRGLFDSAYFIYLFW